MQVRTDNATPFAALPALQKAESNSTEVQARKLLSHCSLFFLLVNSLFTFTLIIQSSFRAILFDDVIANGRPRPIEMLISPVSCSY